MHSKEFEEGRLYYHQFGTAYQNPYAIGTLEHNDFERGWSQALKRYPNVGERIDRERAQNEERQKQREARIRAERAAAYRRTKDSGEF